jgi:phosphoribosylaminoimidazole carboxylase PurE protein
MGSDSDLPTMKAAEDILHEFGVPCELSIVSAHRTPERMMDYARSAHKRGLQVCAGWDEVVAVNRHLGRDVVWCGIA